MEPEKDSRTITDSELGKPTPSDFFADGLPPEREIYTPAQEAQVVRKLDWNLMPLLFVLYMLAFLDRGNIGNAKIAGMATDLNLTGNKYQWLINIFYITYIIFDFSILLWKIFPPHIVCTIVVFGWGLLATVQAGVQVSIRRCFVLSWHVFGDTSRTRLCLSSISRHSTHLYCPSGPY